MILRVTQYNEPILRQEGDAVTEFGADIAKLSADMIETMYEAEGIGLAAQQVGYPLQLCVIDVPQHPDSPFSYILDGGTPPIDLIMPMTLINPKVELLPSHITEYDEGCLSFPGITGIVQRPDKIRVTYQDVEGNSHTLECDGLLGRCVQHEVDHLNGTLFIDRMEKRFLKSNESKIRKLKKQTQKYLRDQEKAKR